MKYLLEYLDNNDNIQPVGLFNTEKEAYKFLEDMIYNLGYPLYYFRQWDESGMMMFDFIDHSETFFLNEVSYEEKQEDDNEV